MSSFERRSFLLSLAALAGCGFEPVYAPDGAGDGLRGRIDVLPPADEEGFALVNRLEDRLGAPESPDYTLTANIRIREEAVGRLPDGSISRYNVVGRVPWALRRGDEAVLSGTERSFTSYSATSTTVSTIIAQRAARERLMIIVADRIAATILAKADTL